MNEVRVCVRECMPTQPICVGNAEEGGGGGNKCSNQGSEETMRGSFTIYFPPFLRARFRFRFCAHTGSTHVGTYA